MVRSLCAVNAWVRSGRAAAAVSSTRCVGPGELGVDAGGWDRCRATGARVDEGVPTRGCVSGRTQAETEKSLSLARRAPWDIDSSFAHTTRGLTQFMPTKVPNPQSVPAITRSGPTSRA